MALSKMGEVRRLVAEGSIQRGDRFIWVCPICCIRVSSGGDLPAVKQAGMKHCLVHACFSDSGTAAIVEPAPRAQRVSR